ncbi:hypothetical protein SAMN04487972_107132 [Paracoccus halophilus]|uniref:Uncharacterized protein n=1 Tax=Paracoccus halophilus TaxID=376733 RepID=A0A099EXY7_9RHOB|nr:hypothetical protein [Paracoccus halophilus]KGJ03039.1 hypothetical protein IT41_15615 [Paracoccus halophilus]SFA50300.1 hypothetical protein SAMN04487972_107132 [Paracoccus halophilus]
MAPLDAYLAPQAQQAVIAGMFIAAGWWVVAFQNAWRDRRQRRSRVEDMQRALLAEVRAHVVSLERQLQEGSFDELLERVENGDATLVMQHGGNDRIFRAILTEIHLLPGSVIDPVVIYYRLIAVMDNMADSIRRTARNRPDQASEMMVDYILLNEEAREAGLDVLEILTASLQGGAAEIEAMLERQREEAGKTIRQNLPQELAQMRDDLNRRFSDRSGL